MTNCLPIGKMSTDGRDPDPAIGVPALWSSLGTPTSRRPDLSEVQKSALGHPESHSHKSGQPSRANETEGLTSNSVDRTLPRLRKRTTVAPEQESPMDRSLRVVPFSRRPAPKPTTASDALIASILRRLGTLDTEQIQIVELFIAAIQRGMRAV